MSITIQENIGLGYQETLLSVFCFRVSVSLFCIIERKGSDVSMNEIQLIISEIKGIFENDYSGHDIWHSLRVYKVALKIADTEKCNKRLVAIATLLHDVDDPKLFDNDNYENAEKIMKRTGVDSNTVTQVFAIIEKVSFKGIDSEVPDTIEGKIVQDVDRLDAMGAIGIARAFAYGGAKGRIMHNPDMPPLQVINHKEYVNNKGTTVNHFYEKLFSLKSMMNTDCAKAMAEKRDLFMHEYICEFLNEWAGCK